MYKYVLTLRLCSPNVVAREARNWKCPGTQPREKNSAASPSLGERDERCVRPYISSISSLAASKIPASSH